MGLRLLPPLPLVLKSGLVPHEKPGLLWSLQVCHGMPHWQSHLAAEDDHKQHGHLSWVQATPLTKVLLAASLSFWHTARGHCSMKVGGGGADCPVPSAQAVSFCSLRSTFSAEAALMVDCSGGSQGQFKGSRKEEGRMLLLFVFLPGLFRVRSWLCIMAAAS